MVRGLIDPALVIIASRTGWGRTEMLTWSVSRIIRTLNFIKTD